MAENAPLQTETGPLTQEDRRALGCTCTRLGDVWHHGRFCPVPMVEVMVRRAQIEALAEARADIKQRIDTFRDLNADRQYLNALNDAWGLVANRQRQVISPAQTSIQVEDRG